jgi:hypothetical protein
MQPRELKVGEIVQIDPAHTDERGEQWFGACLMVVTEPKSWGAQGYVQSAGVPGQQYYRCKFEHMEPTGGMAPWVVASADAE